jgi:hypothetical protein
MKSNKNPAMATAAERFSREAIKACNAGANRAGAAISASYVSMNVTTSASAAREVR